LKGKAVIPPLRRLRYVQPVRTGGRFNLNVQRLNDGVPFYLLGSSQGALVWIVHAKAGACGEAQVILQFAGGGRSLLLEE
jgi:hypothetical protein